MTKKKRPHHVQPVQGYSLRLNVERESKGGHLKDLLMKTRVELLKRRR